MNTPLLDPGANWCPDCGERRDLCQCDPPPLRNKTKRFAHIRALVELRANVLDYPNPADAVHDAIVSALPPGYRKIYNWMAQGIYGGAVNSSMVVKAWDLQQNHASTILNELWQFGLLTRTEYTDEHGKGYKYTVAD